ncbi:MAG: class I tRNA ligase family protein [Planctomycetes bacterium]|nr:class I tRNA ligase family protein [Planctomycetota bacterium]
MTLNMSLDKAYDAHAVQDQVAAWWDQANAFHAVPGAGGDPYVIVIPPPNVTAALHMGHALNNTIQDILIRWQRMRGKNAVWIPGTDHAGIATQTIVDKRLQSEGKKSLKDYKKIELDGGDGRAQFEKLVWAWKDEYEARITNQLQQMGCSCDFDRQRFTMDDICARAVREAFFELFKAGLIYRGKRLVNWDPVTQTALADDEVEMREIDGHFWYMKYPIIDEAGGLESPRPQYVTVATTRPETMLGDTAVAVNPNDPVNAKYIGQHVKLPIVNRIIPIIGDDYVVIPDPDSDDAKAKFASGFLKVTPAHDPNDYEIGRRHNLAAINVMAPDGTISEKHGWLDFDPAAVDEFCHELLGRDRYEAREAIVTWFRDQGLLAEVRPYSHSVGHSYRSHVPVEPYLSDQWYVKVTDDRLAGAALRAMANDQRSQTTPTSRDREGAVQPAAADQSALAYFITWSTYGCRLHGDERGTVHHATNLPGEPIVIESQGLHDTEADLMSSEPFTLDAAQRSVVRDTILEVCQHRGWRALVINVRTDHVHIVIEAADAPEKVMNDFKAYATRRLREASLVGNDQKLWARHGSTRYLNSPDTVEEACIYVHDRQGDDLGGTYRWDLPNEPRTSVSGPGGAQESDVADRSDIAGPLPHGRGSWEGELRFYPARYARTFQSWHENIRDWCISRQLWWGHRIPVWSRPKWDGEAYTEAQVMAYLQKFVVLPSVGDDKRKAAEMMAGICCVYEGDALYLCLRETRIEQAISPMLAQMGYTQDPDVLDTWFSSALWPISTLGWPEGTAELAAWNPSSTLCTAREIITLWVSRMVMFNLFFRACLPFKDVFIHAMIQDGEGQKMSKSLGNGVDPLDIIHSHGADAMRFTLAAMTTQTQDVGMPVDVVCPHCGHAFHPRTIKTPAGYVVAAPMVECESCHKKMATSFGVASGQAPGSDDAPAARNTSSKFDYGRNFANKLWNAGRFAMGILEEGAGGLKSPRLEIADRWILSRLARTIEKADKALAEYQFSYYAQEMYSFFWGDLCDWYLEAIKPVVREASDAGAAARATLAACLDASLRLLHPAMPYVTERMWRALNEIAPERGVTGLTLEPQELCIRAKWPKAEAALIDDKVETQFDLLKQVIVAIRTVRNEYNIPPRQSVKVAIKATGDSAAAIASAKAVIDTLAICETGDIGPGVAPGGEAATVVVGEIEVYVEGLIDPAAERQRLAKRLDELTKSRGALNGRLNNKGYTDKAPAHLVEQTRQQLADVEKELATVESKLAAYK